MIPKSQSQTCIFDRGKCGLEKEKLPRSKSLTTLCPSNLQNSFGRQIGNKCPSYKIEDKPERSKIVLCKNGVKKIIPRSLINHFVESEQPTDSKYSVKHEQNEVVTSSVKDTNQSKVRQSIVPSPNTKWAWQIDTTCENVHSNESELKTKTNYNENRHTDTTCEDVHLNEFESETKTSCKENRFTDTTCKDVHKIESELETKTNCTENRHMHMTRVDVHSNESELKTKTTYKENRQTDTTCKEVHLNESESESKMNCKENGLTVGKETTMDCKEDGLTAVKKTENAHKYSLKGSTDGLNAQNTYVDLHWRERENLQCKYSFDTRLHVHKTSFRPTEYEKRNNALPYKTYPRNWEYYHHGSSFTRRQDPVIKACIPSSRQRYFDQYTFKPWEKFDRKKRFSASSRFPTLLNNEAADAYCTHKSIGPFTRHHYRMTHSSIRSTTYNSNKFNTYCGPEIDKEKPNRDAEKMTNKSKHLNQNFSRALTDTDALSSSQDNYSRSSLQQADTAAYRSSSSQYTFNKFRHQYGSFSSKTSDLRETCVDTGKVEKMAKRKQICRLSQTDLDVSLSTMDYTEGEIGFGLGSRTYCTSCTQSNLNGSTSISSDVGRSNCNILSTSLTSNGTKWDSFSNSKSSHHHAPREILESSDAEYISQIKRVNTFSSDGTPQKIVGRSKVKKLLQSHSVYKCSDQPAQRKNQEIHKTRNLVELSRGSEASHHIRPEKNFEIQEAKDLPKSKASSPPQPSFGVLTPTSNGLNNKNVSGSSKQTQGISDSSDSENGDVQESENGIVEDSENADHVNEMRRSWAAENYFIRQAFSAGVRETASERLVPVDTVAYGPAYNKSQSVDDTERRKRRQAFSAGVRETASEHLVKFDTVAYRPAYNKSQSVDDIERGKRKHRSKAQAKSSKTNAGNATTSLGSSKSEFEDNSSRPSVVTSFGDTWIYKPAGYQSLGQGYMVRSKRKPEVEMSTYPDGTNTQEEAGKRSDREKNQRESESKWDNWEERELIWDNWEENKTEKAGEKEHVAKSLSCYRNKRGRKGESDSRPISQYETPTEGEMHSYSNGQKDGECECSCSKTRRGPCRSYSPSIKDNTHRGTCARYCLSGKGNENMRKGVSTTKQRDPSQENKEKTGTEQKGDKISDESNESKTLIGSEKQEELPRSKNEKEEVSDIEKEVEGKKNGASSPNESDKEGNITNRSPTGKRDSTTEPESKASVKESDTRVSTNQNKGSENSGDTFENPPPVLLPEIKKQPETRLRETKRSDSSTYDAAITFFKETGMNHFAQVLLDKMDTLRQANGKLKFVAPQRKGLYITPQPYPLWIYPNDPLGLYKYILKIRGKSKPRVLCASTHTFTGASGSTCREVATCRQQDVCPNMRDSPQPTGRVQGWSTCQAHVNTPERPRNSKLRKVQRNIPQSAQKSTVRSPQRSNCFFVPTSPRNSSRGLGQTPPLTRSWFSRSRSSSLGSSYRFLISSSGNTWKHFSAPGQSYVSQRTPPIQIRYQSQKPHNYPCKYTSFKSPSKREFKGPPTAPSKPKRDEKLPPPQKLTRCPHCRKILQGPFFAPYIKYPLECTGYLTTLMPPTKRSPTSGGCGDFSQQKKPPILYFIDPPTHLKRDTSRGSNSKKSRRPMKDKQSSSGKHSSKSTTRRSSKSEKSGGAYTSHISAIYVGKVGRHKTREERRKKKQKGSQRAGTIVKSSNKSETHKDVSKKSSVKSSKTSHKSKTSKGPAKGEAPEFVARKQAQMSEKPRNEEALEAKSRVSIPSDRKLRVGSKKSRIPIRQYDFADILKPFDEHIGMRTPQSHRRHRSSQKSPRVDKGAASDVTRQSFHSSRASSKQVTLLTSDQADPKQTASPALKLSLKVARNRPASSKHGRGRRHSRSTTRSSQISTPFEKSETAANSRDVGFNRFFQQIKNLTRRPSLQSTGQTRFFIHSLSEDLMSHSKYRKKRLSISSEREKKRTKRASERKVSKCRKGDIACRQRETSEKMQHAQVREVSTNQLKESFDDSYKVVLGNSKSPFVHVQTEDTSHSNEDDPFGPYGSSVDEKRRTTLFCTPNQQVYSASGDSSYSPPLNIQNTQKNDEIKSKKDQIRFVPLGGPEKITIEGKDQPLLCQENREKCNQDKLSPNSRTKQRQDKDISTVTLDKQSLKRDDVESRVKTEVHQEQGQASRELGLSFHDQSLTDFSNRSQTYIDKSAAKILSSEKKRSKKFRERQCIHKPYVNKPYHEVSKASRQSERSVSTVTKSRSTSPKSNTPNTAYDTLTTLSSLSSLKQRPFKIHGTFYNDKSVLNLSPAIFPTIGAPGYFSRRRFRQTMDSGPVDAFRLRTMTLGKYGGLASAGFSAYESYINPSRFAPALRYHYTYHRNRYT